MKRTLSALFIALGALGLVLAPTPVSAASAALVPAGTVVSLPSAGIALHVPADGRLRGYGFAAVVRGVGFASSAGPADSAVRAPSGDQLCVVELSLTLVTGLIAAPPPTPVPGLVAAVVVGSTSEPLDLIHLEGGDFATYAAAVPKGSDPELQLSAAGVSQDFSLRALERTGTVPAVFYRGATGPDLDVTGSPSITLPGTATDGTAVGVSATLAVALSYFSPSDPTTNAGDPSQAFLVVQPSTASSAGTTPSFEGFGPLPPGSVQLALPDGTVVPAQGIATDAGLLFGTYVFAVPADITTATYEVEGGTIGAVESPPPASTGALTQITFSPASAPLTFTTAAFVPTTLPTTPGPGSSGHQTSGTPASAESGAKKRANGGFPVAAGAGAGAGGVIVVVLVIVIPIRRRRYPYSRADRRGQLVVYAPPPLPRPPIALPPPPAEPAPSPKTVEVRVVGPIELVGLIEPTGRSAVDELLVYLALHPGQVFPGAELRSRIWADPRREPTSKAFCNTLYYLRKALPAEAYEKTRQGPKLTEVVASDWGQLKSLIADHGETRNEKLTAALRLVRGHPFAGVKGRAGDSPYDWAYQERLVSEMETTVEAVAHELAMAMLQADDTEHARWAIDQGCRCVPGSLLLYGDLLRVGAARDGATGVERAMAEAQRVLGDDAGALEDLARQLAGH